MLTGSLDSLHLLVITWFFFFFFFFLPVVIHPVSTERPPVQRYFVMTTTHLQTPCLKDVVRIKCDQMR